MSTVPAHTCTMENDTLFNTFVHAPVTRGTALFRVKGPRPKRVRSFIPAEEVYTCFSTCSFKTGFDMHFIRNAIY